MNVTDQKVKSTEGGGRTGIMKDTTHRRVELFDTSLRDGMQQPNLEISVPNADFAPAAHVGVWRALRRDWFRRGLSVCGRPHAGSCGCRYWSDEAGPVRAHAGAGRPGCGLARRAVHGGAQTAHSGGGGGGEVAAARCGTVARNHSGREPAHGLGHHRLPSGPRPRGAGGPGARHGRGLRQA